MKYFLRRKKVTMSFWHFSFIFWCQYTTSIRVLWSITAMTSGEASMKCKSFTFLPKIVHGKKASGAEFFSFFKSNMKVCFVCVCVPWWIYITIQTKKLVGVKSKLMTLSNNSWRFFWANRPTPVWKLTVSKFTIFTPKSNKDEWKGNVNGCLYL